MSEFAILRTIVERWDDDLDAVIGGRRAATTSLSAIGPAYRKT
jgi:hypothetical protein